MYKVTSSLPLAGLATPIGDDTVDLIAADKVASSAPPAGPATFVDPLAATRYGIILTKVLVFRIPAG